MIVRIDSAKLMRDALHDMTYKKLASLAGLSFTAVYKTIASGSRAKVSTLRKICAARGLNYLDYITEPDDGCTFIVNAELLAKLVKEHGLTRRGLGLKIGMSITYIGQTIKHTSEMPLRILKRLAAELGVDWQALTVHIYA